MPGSASGDGRDARREVSRRQRLDELRRKLADEAPEAVKAKLAKDGPEQGADLAAAPKTEATFRSAGKLDMPAI